METQLQVRPATEDDWGAVYPLLQRMGHVDSAEAAHDRSLCIVRNSAHYVPLAIMDGEVVGYGWVQDYGPHLRSGEQTARLHDLYIHPRHRGHGAGRALFDAVRLWAQRSGMRYLEWQAPLSAVPFYHRLGFDGDPCPQPDFPFYEIDFSADDVTG